MNSSARRAQRKAKLRAAVEDFAFISVLVMIGTFAAGIVGGLWWFLVTLAFLG